MGEPPKIHGPSSSHLTCSGLDGVISNMQIMTTLALFSIQRCTNGGDKGTGKGTREDMTKWPNLSSEQEQK